MARYSSDSDDSRRSKKRRHRSRSRSLSSPDSYTSSRSRKKKKSKKKQRKRSRSRSSDYRRRRSRSRSRSRRRSRSRSRRSRSRSRNRRSRSRNRRSRSGSYQRSRRRRSRSYRRSYSKSPGNSRSRRNSYSRSRSRSRSRQKSEDSTTRNKPSGEARYREAKAKVTESTRAEDPCSEIPGFQDMTPAEQNEVRMQMALKAAAETTARLREQGVLSVSSGVEAADVEKRQKAIADIDGDGFVQQSFTSSRSNPKRKEESRENQHEAAMFGDTASLTTAPKTVYKESDSILAPIFFEDIDAKWDRWVDHLKEYRRRKLEGEAMS